MQDVLSLSLLVFASYLLLMVFFQVIVGLVFIELGVNEWKYFMVRIVSIY